MLRKEVSARSVAIATVLILGIVQFVYWRLLVYAPPGSTGGGGGGGGPAGPPIAVGLPDVQVETLAGDTPGFADGPAWKARFCGPNALVVDRDGTVLVADSRNHRIRRVTSAGNVSTEAGGGTQAGPGQVPALEAKLRYPAGLALEDDGALVISDTGNHRLCRLKDGKLAVLAGGTDGEADGQGVAARFHAPAAVTLGPDDAFWVLDAADLHIRRVQADGTVTTPADVPAPVRTALGEITPQPAAPKISAWPNRWDAPAATIYNLGRRSPGCTVAAGWQYYADTEHGSVYLQQSGGPPLLLAGRRPEVSSAVPSDGPGEKAGFLMPSAVAAAPDGSLYVAEYEGDRIRRLRLPDWLLAGQPTAPERRGRGGRRRGDRESGRRGERGQRGS